MPNSVQSTVGAPQPPAAKKHFMLLMQLVLTLAAFAYLFHISNFRALGSAFRAAPLWSVPTATFTLLCVMFAGTLRWNLLMAAYGARSIPSIGYLFRLQLIGLFYNMMPGAVGGDVLRGVVSRHAFGPQGMSAGLTVVLVERVFGLLALMLLVVSVLSLHPIHGLHLAPWVFVVGLLGSFGCLAGIALGRRLAPYLPAALARRARELPELSRPGFFVIALIMSVLNQALVGVVGHCAIGPLAPQIQLLDSLVLSPLAFAAIFFPLTVAGAGTRDAAMVALYGLLEVNKETALSASLEILLAYALVAAIGGVLSLVTPLRDSNATAADGDASTMAQ
jgi:uncharacterized membrane protein YbhN (UPF0104 family)